MYRFLRGLMRFMVHVYLFGKWRLDGRENVPRTGPLVICPNHIATIDPPLVPAFIPRNDSWSMAKSEWFRKPGFQRWLFTEYHAFPVVRHTADRGALKRAMDILRAGHALVIYPEGTRIEAPGLAQAEPGAAFLAMKLDAPVLPVAIVGTRGVIPRGRIWPRRVQVSMTCGRPFRISAVMPDGSRTPPEAATDAVMLGIAELLPETMRGEYADLDGLRARVGSLRLY